MKNKPTLLLIAAVAFFGVGCSSTVTLGPKANDDGYLSASANGKGVSVTLPFVQAGVAVTEEKKK